MSLKDLQKHLIIRITLQEEALGMSPGADILDQFIAKNSPDAKSRKEELEAMMKTMDADDALAEMIEKGTTVFPRDDEGVPFLWDYQFKGALKDICGLVSRIEGSLSSKFSAYKKKIGGLVMPGPRKIRLILPEGEKMGICQRPLRSATARGEITALASSETVPAGTTAIVDIGYYELKGEAPKEKKKGGKPVLDENGKKVFTPSVMRETILEWLEYGEERGLCQWRSSGKGRFTFEILEG